MLHNEHTFKNWNQGNTAAAAAAKAILDLSNAAPFSEFPHHLAQACHSQLPAPHQRTFCPCFVTPWWWFAPLDIHATFKQSLVHSQLAIFTLKLLFYYTSNTGKNPCWIKMKHSRRKKTKMAIDPLRGSLIGHRVTSVHSQNKQLQSSESIFPRFLLGIYTQIHAYLSTYV